MPGLRTSARTNGIGLPNYQAGWFRLNNREKALVFVTDWSRSVIVPTTEDYTLLANPEDPDGFISGFARCQIDVQGVARITRSSDFNLPPLRREAALSLLGYSPSRSSPLCSSPVCWSGCPDRRGRCGSNITTEGLRIRGPYGRLIPLDALDSRAGPSRSTSSPIPTYRVGIRTNGIGMPGYASGWFRLKGGSQPLSSS